MHGIKEVDAVTLKEMMDKDENIQLYDVRSQAEYQQGIIEGGIFMPMHTVPLKMNELPKDKTIVFYCRSGARSAQVCAYVQQNTDIEPLNLRNGIIAWYQAGFEIVRPDGLQAQG